MHHRRPGGVYHFLLSALDSRNILRKEALGMGDVLLFAALGSGWGRCRYPMLL